MPELNKFLDLEGLKVFWEQINEKKQNRKIWYNGKEMLLEDCLNEIKTEIENVQKEIGNIEELDQINEHIEKIQSTLQEIDNQLNNLEENYVPESRTIGGLSLANDITSEQLQQLITTYPVLTGTTIPGDNTKGEKNQLYINENTGLFYICYSISNPDTSPYYFWRQIKINTAHIVSSVSSSSTDIQAPSAKLFYNTTQVLNGGIDESNLSNTFYDAGAIQNTNAIWPGTNDYAISGSYEVLGQTCTLNIGIKIKSDYGEMWYPLPIMPYSATNQYSLIYTHDSKNVLYLVSVGDQKPTDAPTEYPHLLHVKRVDGKAIAQDDELHLIFSYRIR